MPKGTILDKSRVAAFNDGLIAIAMTLLILNVEPTLVGHVSTADVWQQLRTLLPNLFGFALSFWVISRYWVANQLFFKALKEMNTTILTWNLLLLLVIALMPFPTKLLTSTSINAASATIYAVTVSAACFLQAILWRFLVKRETRTEETSTFMAYYQMLKFTLSGLVFLISIPVAHYSVWIAVAIWVVFGFNRLFTERSAESLSELEDKFLARYQKCKSVGSSVQK